MKWLVSVRLCGINICGGTGSKVASMLEVGAELGVVGWVQEGSRRATLLPCHCVAFDLNGKHVLC